MIIPVPKKPKTNQLNGACSGAVIRRLAKCMEKMTCFRCVCISWPSPMCLQSPYIGVPVPAL